MRVGLGRCVFGCTALCCWREATYDTIDTYRIRLHDGCMANTKPTPARGTLIVWLAGAVLMAVFAIHQATEGDNWTAVGFTLLSLGLTASVVAAVKPGRKP